MARTSFSKRQAPLIRPGKGMLPGDSGETQRLTRALVLVAMVTIGGTVGFVEIEGWSVWRAFYFTLITITTVGYGDEGLSVEGKKFAALLLVGGVTSASYTFAMIIQSSIALQLAWRKRMKKNIRRVKDHTIVCGFGRLGFSVCEKLEARGAAFVVIERDPGRFARAVERGYLAVEGTASENDALLEAGLDRARHVVAAMGCFAENIAITMEVRDARPEADVIARAERPEDVRKLQRVGAGRVLCPFESGGRELADCITSPGVADFLAQAALGDGDVALAEVHIGAESELVGLTLGEFGRVRGDRLSFVACEREGGEVCIPPRGDTLFAAGDHLIVAGDPEQIALMTELAAARSTAA